ncbi:MAG: choice-of-anchor B family protein [Bacteroidota bacterium]
MTKRFFSACSLILLIGTNVFSQNNIQLLSSLVIQGQRLAGCWHYADTTGHEYALIGAEQGIVFLDITDPSQPTQLFQLPGNTSIWHEVKVMGHYAYAVSEGVDTGNVKNGVQIMDLRYLPDSVPYKFWQGDGLIQGQLVKAHSITADSGFIYVNGHNINSLGNGVLICSIADPWNPAFVGAVVNNYSHDSYVRGTRLYSSEIFAGQFSIYDITNPASPALLASQVTPGAFNHNSWLNDAGTVLFTTDEQNNAPVASYDITDVSNITLLDQYLTLTTPNKEVHNVRVINDYLVNPSYGSQLTIADVSRPGNIIEVGSYPTGSFLCWDADPYLESGAVLATDMNSQTVFLFQPNYVRACYLEGTVTDSITGIPLANVQVALAATTSIKNTGVDGRYSTGASTPGVWDAIFSKSGYRSKTVSGINLVSGQLTPLDVELAPNNIAVGEISNLDSWMIHPQPADDYLAFDLKSRSEISFKICGLGGNMIKEGRINPSSAAKAIIDTDEIPSGVYLLTLKTTHGLAAGKITIMH